MVLIYLHLFCWIHVVLLQSVFALKVVLTFVLPYNSLTRVLNYSYIAHFYLPISFSQTFWNALCLIYNLFNNFVSSVKHFRCFNRRCAESLSVSSDTDVSALLICSRHKVSQCFWWVGNETKIVLLYDTIWCNIDQYDSICSETENIRYDTLRSIMLCFNAKQTIQYIWYVTIRHVVIQTIQ